MQCKSIQKRFIEVKTTSFGEETPFFISRNEGENLFEFRKSPRLFDLAGPVERKAFSIPFLTSGDFRKRGKRLKPLVGAVLRPLSMAA